MNANTDILNRMRALLAQFTVEERAKLAQLSAELEIYRPDDDAEWRERDALSGLMRSLLYYAAAHIDEVPRDVPASKLPSLHNNEQAHRPLKLRLIALGWSGEFLRFDMYAGACLWSLARPEAVHAWLSDRLTACTATPEIIDIATRAARHAVAYQEARRAFRRTYGRQPRKAELASLGPWMRYVERYRARAEQLCEERPELLRWYIDHIATVADAPSWEHCSIDHSLARGRRLFAQAEAEVSR
jgi:hypothetical protein